MTEQELRQRIRSIEESTDNPEEHRIELEMLYEWLDDVERCKPHHAWQENLVCWKCEIAQDGS